MAEDSTIEYELNEYEILDENETQDIGQIYVIAQDDSNEQIDEIYLEEENITDSSTIVRCDICDREFPSIAERNQHIEEHFKQIECPLCSRKFVGDRAYEFHTSTGKCKAAKVKSKLFRCNLCNEKVFDSMDTLNNHMRSKHKCSISGERFNCEQCDRTFGKIKYLRKHIYELHDMATPFHCKTCGKKFNRKANLIEHELIHDGIKLANCETCGKSYRTASALKLHVRTHTGEKPYACDLCEKAYAYNTDLKRHKRSAHGILGTPYPCKMCDRIFYEPKLLRNHEAKAHKEIRSGI